jgi:inner membrane protein
MEPVTHFLTGACLARTGFNRKIAYATLAMTLAAEAPDLDVFWAFEGPVAAFRHHRGITHTFIAAPFMAAITVGAMWLWHRFKMRRGRPPAMQPRWFTLWLLALLADLSHILLDYTNNYGIRPFFPFSAKWYEADLVFVLEPILLAVLALALLVPLLLRFVDQEIGGRDEARRVKHRGRQLAVAALVCMVALWVWRAAEHHAAIGLVREQSPPEESIVRIAAEPYPVNPFRWHAVAETPDSYRVAEVDTAAEHVSSDPTQDVYFKPADTPATRAAKNSPLGRVYLDWAKFPLVEEGGKHGQWTEVDFRDLRFSYAGFGFLAGDRTPLSASVEVAPDGTVTEMRFNGHVQH